MLSVKEWPSLLVLNLGNGIIMKKEIRWASRAAATSEARSGRAGQWTSSEMLICMDSIPYILPLSPIHINASIVGLLRHHWPSPFALLAGTVTSPCLPGAQASSCPFF